MRMVVLAAALLLIGLVVWRLPRLSLQAPRLRLWGKLALGGLLLVWLGMVLAGALLPEAKAPAAALPEGEAPLLRRLAVWLAPGLVLAALAVDLAAVSGLRRSGGSVGHALLFAFSATLLLGPLCALLAWVLLGTAEIGPVLGQLLKGAVFAWGGFALLAGILGGLWRLRP